MNAAEKAQQTRTEDMARLAQFALLAMAKASYTEADVVRLFSMLPISPVRRCDVFWQLDNSPGIYGGDYCTWHSLLRRTRNHPIHGKELFALFR